MSLRQIIKKIPGFNTLNEVRKNRIKKKELEEVKRKIATDTLMEGLPEQELENWRIRIADVLASEDNQKMDFVSDAGTMKGDYFVMHNGLLIEPLSYYGYPVLQMLVKSKGIHEPQEEYAFQEVLKVMKPGSTMLELGAYWSFYSMWFNQQVAEAKNYMIEPWEIHHGIKNFEINKMKGDFSQYYISDKPGKHEDGTDIINIDTYIEQKSIDFLDILHSDIQGQELEMLHGAKKLLNDKKVGYIFVSTHSNELHKDCSDFLKDLGYTLVCSADKDQTFSYDGLLVFKNPEYEGPDKLEISLKGNAS